MIAWCAVFGGDAQAADVPALWVRQYTAVTLNPLGALADLTAEVRVPVLRYGGAVFNDTFLGVGARTSLSPAFVENALRLSFQPIDVLPITIEGVRSDYWESPFGLVPVGAMGEASPSGLKPSYAADRDFAGHAWSLVVSPTLQARVGPVVGFSNVNLTFFHLRPDETSERWVFEPYRGMVVAYDDQLLEHTSALLWEPLDGEDRALVRVGPVLRGKSSQVTPDVTLTCGALVQVRPGHGEHAPSFTALATPYLRDPDRQGLAPHVAVVVTFTDEVPLTR